MLLQWLGTVDGLTNYDKLNLFTIKNYEEVDILDALSDGTILAEALSLMDEEIFYKG